MAAWRSLFYAPAECRINGKYGASWRFLRRDAPESLSLSLSCLSSLVSALDNRRPTPTEGLFVCIIDEMLEDRFNRLH